MLIQCPLSATYSAQIQSRAPKVCKHLGDRHPFRAFGAAKSGRFLKAQDTQRGMEHFLNYEVEPGRRCQRDMDMNVRASKDGTWCAVGVLRVGYTSQHVSQAAACAIT